VLPYTILTIHHAPYTTQAVALKAGCFGIKETIKECMKKASSVKLIEAAAGE
jgi:hypothetical protein